MPYSPKLIRSAPLSGDNGHRVNLKLRYNFEEITGSEEKARQAEAAELSREIITAAEAEAEQIKQEALREAGEIARQKAEELAAAAREEGYREGYREGLAKAEAEAEEIRARARRVLQAAEKQRSALLASLEQEIVGLSVEIAEKIVCQQLTLAPETILAVTREALHAARNRQSLTIYVNPADRQTVESQLGELQKLLAGPAALAVLADEAISPGGLVVETEHGRVDATLETRWETISTSLGWEGSRK